MVHGKLKPAEKDSEMRRFVTAETKILVSTTVIEVGVNAVSYTHLITSTWGGMVFFCQSLARWATPKRCCSSMITRPIF